MTLTNRMAFTLLLFAISPMAHSYIGPGAGLSAIGSVLAFLGASLLLVVGFLWYPIKRLFKSKKEKTTQQQDKSQSKTGSEQPAKRSDK